MTEHTRALALAIAERLGVSTEGVADVIDGVIRDHVAGAEVGTPNPLVSTIYSIANDDTHEGTITLRPEGEEWVLYIPPTTPEAFEIPVDPEEDPDNQEPIYFVLSQVREPYGWTRWSSLQAAIGYLSITHKTHNIKYNDGRIAE